MNAPLCPRMNGVCCTEPASPNPFMNSQWQRPLAKGCSGLERLRMAPEENLLRTLFRHKKAHFESKLFMFWQSCYSLMNVINPDSMM